MDPAFGQGTAAGCQARIEAAAGVGSPSVQALRDRALFDFAMDCKLQGCDVVKVQIGDIVLGGHVRDRAIVLQQKTKRPVDRSRLPINEAEARKLDESPAVLLFAADVAVARAAATSSCRAVTGRDNSNHSPLGLLMAGMSESRLFYSSETPNIKARPLLNRRAHRGRT